MQKPTDIPYTYVIGTGWWCSPRPITWKPIQGDDCIRSREFHRLWYYAIDKYTCPEKICIVDSASPIRPEMADDPRLEWMSLNHNFHTYHSPYHEAFDHSGWVKSALLSAYYALMCEADYFIYVEQDCLVRGDGWVDAVVNQLDEHVAAGHPGWMFGDGRNGCPGNHDIQQSLFVIKQSHLWPFIQRLTPRPKGPSLMAEERFSTQLENYALLPFGYGRSRRDFSLQALHIYAQHWTQDELRAWCCVEAADNEKKGRSDLNKALRRATSGWISF